MGIPTAPFGHSDQRYSRILELAADAIICIDNEQRISLFNNGAERTFGYNAAEMLGQPLDRLIPTRFRHGHQVHVGSFGNGPPVARHMGERQAIFALRKSGEEFPAEATISKIALEKGHILTVVLRDVTERVGREEERRRDAEKFQQALAAGKLGAFEQNISTARVLLYGEATRILGIQKNECHLDEIVALIHKDDRAGMAAFTQGIAEQQAIDREFRIRRPDGTTVWIHAIATLHHRPGDASYVHGVVQDITHHKEVEQELERRVLERTNALQTEIRQREETQRQLVHAQRMEAFGQLTGGIAHDFNNLLTIVGGNLELAQDQVSGERPLLQLKRALEAVEMGSRLTKRLLTFARRNRLAPEVLNLNDQVINMIDLLRRTIGETITISSVLGPNLGKVRADPSEIENAILNLAINARDAMPDGGKLVIETANASIDNHFVATALMEAVTPGDYVRLSVTDTGVGMAPHVITRAFEPFFTTKEHGRGTGLGLATIYGFARQSGGHVTIHSELGLGATVNIYLPRTVESAGTEVANYPTVVSRGQKRILVVEDNPEVREVTTQRLEKLGYEFLATDSGPAAIKILQADTSIDLVFSDIMMAGGMSGYDVADWLKVHQPNVRVLLTSGFSGEQAQQKAAGAGDYRLLRKPYATADLAKAINEAFQND